MSRPAASAPVTNWVGSFIGHCQSAPLPICPLVGHPAGQASIPAICYSRNTEIFGRIVLMPPSVAVYFLAFVMSAIMIWHIKQKYTAVGRKEIVIFFYFYVLTLLAELLLTTGIIPAANPIYPHLAAAHVGLISATCWCLLVNGLIAFQVVEDGTRKSVWLVRLSSIFVMMVAYFVAIDTFQGFSKVFDRANPTGLWVLYFILNGAVLMVYVVLQIILVTNRLDSRWPVGDLILATTFFVISYILQFVVGTQICEMADHYIDGTFFASLFNLLAVLMIYKYWDSITKEDLEFSVRSVGSSWDDREKMPLEAEVAGMEQAFYSPRVSTTPLSRRGTMAPPPEYPFLGSAPVPADAALQELSRRGTMVGPAPEYPFLAGAPAPADAPLHGMSRSGTMTGPAPEYPFLPGAPTPADSPLPPARYAPILQPAAVVLGAPPGHPAMPQTFASDSPRTGPNPGPGAGFADYPSYAGSSDPGSVYGTQSPQAVASASASPRQGPYAFPYADYPSPAGSSGYGSVYAQSPQVVASASASPRQGPYGAGQADFAYPGGSDGFRPAVMGNMSFAPPRRPSPAPQQAFAENGSDFFPPPLPPGPPVRWPAVQPVPPPHGGELPFHEAASPFDRAESPKQR